MNFIKACRDVHPSEISDQRPREDRLRMSLVWESLQLQVHLVNPNGGEALETRDVCEGLQPDGKPQSASEDPFWRGTTQV